MAAFEKKKTTIRSLQLC